MERKKKTIDGNEAAAYVAYRNSEVIAIYPITPSSGMGELSDEWAAKGIKNIWGTIPSVSELQSEGGAAGAVHGALQSGALTTTFTASQGLLLMIPNMYKIAGELTPTVFHVSARSITAQGLSIFGDHSDVMAIRQTGFAMLASGSVQEIMDLAAIAHKSTLESRIPFLHFFDGFRSSHEVNKIEMLSDEDLHSLIDDKSIEAIRNRALKPENPSIRGTAHNPDVYFQGRETANNLYVECVDVVDKAMNQFAELTGRQYNLFDYYGAPDATKVIVLMGSGAEAALETVEYLTSKEEKVGIIKVRLFRPFSVKHFIAALPNTVEKIAVLDRTKEPGSLGDPLYLDVVTAISEMMDSDNAPFIKTPKIVSGRYGLSSKEFTPAMVVAIFDELKKDKPKNHFTIGINDNVSNSSLTYSSTFSIEGDDVKRAMFYGLGADGTVGANKNSIKIIGEETDNFAQGYFVYDSKKSGSTTISHLRFGKKPIRSTYLIQAANFIACHQFGFLEKFDVLSNLIPGGTFLLNTPYPTLEETWEKLPKVVQQQIIDKKLKFYVIDAYSVANNTGMGGRINTIMQTCFFAISGVLPKDEAIEQIKKAIKKSYGAKGESVVRQNFEAVDQTLANLHQFEVPATATSTIELPPVVSDKAPDFVKNVLAKMMAGKGDEIPVSDMPIDGVYPCGTTKWEKRNIALEVPAWDSEVCIQCGKCSLACPHAAIRIKVYDKELLKDAPATFKYVDAKGKDFKDLAYTIQVAVEDCTGCALCFEVCPAKNKKEPKYKSLNMTSQIPIRVQERENFEFFLNIPEYDRSKLNLSSVQGSQLLEPLFEFSGACSGCGETPYVKLVTQLFGDRAVVANATGCSSIYGANLPTTPWTANKDGRGPAWANSLFEDNAEFGFGMRLALDKHEEQAKELVIKFADKIGAELVDAVLNSNQKTEAGISEQRERVEKLKEIVKTIDEVDGKRLLDLADYLVKKSLWIIGGDGWAYDIGYGGLDHVLASGKNVNILVLDTEVYSNTGGQMSKSTSIGAVAKFAAAGKRMGKKDLGMMAMTYGNVYVAKVAMGSNDLHTIRALVEAEAYEGPSLVIAYSHCIAHGINMAKGFECQKLAVDSGHWPLFRYNPALKDEGKNPLKLDSKAPKIKLEDYIYNETRYKMLTKSHPEIAKELLILAQTEVNNSWRYYEQLASLDFSELKKEN
ncbi:MAG: pyruvate:ferredoxin (flavodoxin) oxidoreductase [bacterium]